jgi:hypothetical protein
VSRTGLRSTTLNRPQLIARLAQYTGFTRPMIAATYLTGNGIEIGALHNPMLVSSRAHVKYLDAKTHAELVAYYADPAMGVDAKDIVPVDIVTDGETLAGVANGSQDFLIASHMLEHTEDPIGTLKHFFRVLKVGGSVFIVLPDKRFTFDVDRPVTPFEHLVRDHEEGPEGSRREHYAEWARYVLKTADAAQIERQADQMMATHANVHFHVWSQTEMLEMLVRLRTDLGFSFDVEIAAKSGIDFMFVLKKTA